jgi:hypothetical protein
MMLDAEAVSIYIAYFALLVVLICGIIFSKKNKSKFTKNLIFFIVYTAILFIPTFNPENMKGGSSLYFIFFGWIFLLLHLVIFVGVSIWKYISDKSKMA